MQSQGQGGCGIELLGVARYWVKEHITIETPEPSGTLHSCQKTLCHFNAESGGEMTHKGIFYCQMSPWVMKTASHYHKWTTTWMGLSLPKTTLCPSEKQFATMNFKFKEESVQTLQSLQTSWPSTQLPTRASIRWPQVGPARWPPEQPQCLPPGLTAWVAPRLTGAIYSQPVLHWFWDTKCTNKNGQKICKKQTLTQHLRQPAQNTHVLSPVTSPGSNTMPLVTITPKGYDLITDSFPNFQPPLPT